MPALPIIFMLRHWWYGEINRFIGQALLTVNPGIFVLHVDTAIFPPLVPAVMVTAGEVGAFLEHMGLFVVAFVVVWSHAEAHRVLVSKSGSWATVMRGKLKAERCVLCLSLLIKPSNM